MGTPSKKVTVATYANELTAELANSKLNSEGIKSSVHRFSRYRSMGGGGYLLKTSEADAERAKRILAKTADGVDWDEYVDPDDLSIPRCPACRSANVTTTPLTGKQQWLVALTLGLALLSIRRQRRCRKCGKEWES